MVFFPESLARAAAETLDLCRKHNRWLVTAESCTGGLIGAALTSVPGSSDIYYGGMVTYSNTAKETMLGIAPSLIRAEGAVSEKVAFAMARGALDHSPAGIAVAVTGIAGPGGGSRDKPVGTVHLAAVTEDGKTAHHVQLFAGDRDAIRDQTVLAALEMVRSLLEPSP